MKGIPNVIFIEWYDTAVLFDNKVEDLRWARIPTFAYDILTGDGTAIVLHWEEDMLHDLYADHGGGFDEFALNAKSLMIELLMHCPSKAIFVFGTRSSLLRARKAVVSDHILPLNYFTSSYYSVHSPIEGTRYVTSFTEQGMMVLARLEQVSSLKATAPKPRP